MHNPDCTTEMLARIEEAESKYRLAEIIDLGEATPADLVVHFEQVRDALYDLIQLARTCCTK